MRLLIGFLSITLAWTVFAISSASAASLPRCWADEQSGIQDGIFIVDYPTSAQTAQNFAQFLLSSQGIFATQQSVSTDSSLAAIEMTFSAPDHPYQPSLAFPTLEALKEYILSDFTRILAPNPAVTIRCAPAVVPVPALL